MLDQRVNPKTGAKEYCLVSRKTPSRILEWYGKKRPGAETVRKSEARIRYYKHR